jgi:dipeptidyl aminopeptidase/acylaminoacyl peptidase
MGAGLSNNRSMYGTTDIPNYLGSFFNGHPDDATSPLYRERSGLTYADDITTPLLILHGRNDYRVPLGQAQEYYRALKDRNKPVRLVVYPRAGHGLSEYYHQIDRAWRQYRWMAGYALGDGPLEEEAPKE